MTLNGLQLVELWRLLRLPSALPSLGAGLVDHL